MHCAAFICCLLAPTAFVYGDTLPSIAVVSCYVHVGLFCRVCYLKRSVDRSVNLPPDVYYYIFASISGSKRRAENNSGKHLRERRS